MKFRTELNPLPISDLVCYETKMLTLGSCFADEIGNRLHALQFPVQVNPYGVVFNPVSLADLLDAGENRTLQEALFVNREGHWYHHGFHSRLVAESKEALSEKIGQIQQEVERFLHQGNLLMLTFGTAWAYRHLETGQIVSNCHKVPQDRFEKVLLDLDELKSVMSELLQRLLVGNPDLKILLTVSPVRHLKDGLHPNNLSKSVLLLLADYLVQKFDRVFYFPAYELVVDDLRDYRFYKEDLIHPTPQAIDYVFTKFRTACFSELTQQKAMLQESIQRLKNHRVVQNDRHLEQIQQLQRQFEALK